MTNNAAGSPGSLQLVDRRRAERAKLDGASVVLMIGEDEVPSQFQDISKTGFAFRTDRRLGLGTEVSFDGLLHDCGNASVLVTCCARVVRCEKLQGNVFEVGCYYTVMSEDCRDAIDEFVAKAHGRT